MGHYKISKDKQHNSVVKQNKAQQDNKEVYAQMLSSVSCRIQEKGEKTTHATLDLTSCSKLLIFVPVHFLRAFEKESIVVEID